MPITHGPTASATRCEAASINLARIRRTPTISQRVNQVSDDVYGAKTLDNYLNRDAFAQPEPGTFGNHVRNSISGPGFWQVDLALSRLLRFAGAQTLELRVEAFNLLNTFNWGNPATNFRAGTFGGVRGIQGAPRIMQFGVKYAF